MLLVVDNSRKIPPAGPDTRKKQLDWLDAIRKESGWNWSEIARRAGISHATLSKFRNDPGRASVLDTRSVERIAAISPVPHYEDTRGLLPDGFDEDEAAPYATTLAGDDELVDRAVKAMKNGSNHLEPWVLHSDALENAGYRSGDVLIVDFSATPKLGDAVCAQIYDQRGGAETAFRLYHKPYLVASSNSLRHQAPKLIDDRVDVRGVVVASVRPRLSRLAS